MLFLHRGQTVRFPWNRRCLRGAGENRTVWDVTDQLGQPVTSGIYWIHLISAHNQMNTRVLLLR
ncbi:MAG TPA: hypothetical protein PKN04_01290 [bacterium]|nr:hypothetical protein [bacterium]HNT64394.1 hypothetical protein [bacterium]HOX84758.1 hypothetical protein [bacterium]HPG45481.1 hypothetical protein [bacterium]HPM96743.1 hypothetical protein [bacterium]